MHRYSSNRSQRSKGVKIKHVLRICVLVVVCCWLIFQIKRSHYKPKDLESVDTEILSSTHSVDEVVKLGRKGLQPKEIETREEEEEDDEEHEIEEEKDDEIDENEQYKLDDEEEKDDAVNETEEKDGQTAREEHYKADDASSAVTHDHQDQTLDNSKFLEMGVSEHENQTRSRANKYADIASDHGQNNSDSTRIIEESETSLKSTNMSGSQTIVTTEENDPGSSKTDGETEDPDEIQHDAIDSTDVRRLEDDAFDNGEDTVAG